MSCGGCKAISTNKARAAMCHGCRYKPACPTYAAVTVGGQFLSGASHACPRGRWPDAEGIIRWAGVRWYGVPLPVRARLAVEAAWKAFAERLGESYLPGCGCVKPLKDGWARLRSLGYNLFARCRRLAMRGTIVLLALTATAVLGGCVSAGYGSKNEKVLVPASVATTTFPNGTVQRVETAAVTTRAEKHANYSDTTGAGKLAGVALDEFGGVGGILNALGLGGSLTAGGGLLGLVGLVGHLIGHSRGYTQAQVEHAGLAPKVRKS